MQTFLPYPSFRESALSLDIQRLGKQRVEGMQILSALLSKKYDNELESVVNFNPKGWTHHPATLMWKNHEGSLYLYVKEICKVWIEDHGFKDTISWKIDKIIKDSKLNYSDPIWLGDEKLHLSHKSNLLRKDFAYYSKIWTGVSPNLPYVWPVSN